MIMVVYYGPHLFKLTLAIEHQTWMFYFDFKIVFDSSDAFQPLHNAYLLSVKQFLVH